MDILGAIGGFVAGLVLVVYFAERLVRGVVGVSLGFGISAFRALTPPGSQARGEKGNDDEPSTPSGGLVQRPGPLRSGRGRGKGRPLGGDDPARVVGSAGVRGHH